MASITSSTSGNVTTYVITDTEGSTVTPVLNNLIGGGRVMTFTSSGNLHNDGQLLLTTLMQMLSTGLTPTF
jgi:pyruvate/2-oxoacid:ferredoxin oxidoreductase alpha subunit